MTVPPGVGVYALDIFMLSDAVVVLLDCHLAVTGFISADDLLVAGLLLLVIDLVCQRASICGN